MYIGRIRMCMMMTGVLMRDQAALVFKSGYFDCLFQSTIDLLSWDRQNRLTYIERKGKWREKSFSLSYVRREKKGPKGN